MANLFPRLYGPEEVRRKTVPPHGTASRYNSKKHPCRCEDCRIAKNEKAREDGRKRRILRRQGCRHPRWNSAKPGFTCSVCGKYASKLPAGAQRSKKTPLVA